MAVAVAGAAVLQSLTIRATAPRALRRILYIARAQSFASFSCISFSMTLGFSLTFSCLSPLHKNY